MRTFEEYVEVRAAAVHASWMAQQLLAALRGMFEHVDPPDTAFVDRCAEAAAGEDGQH